MLIGWKPGRVVIIETNPDQNNNGDVVFCRSMPFLPDAGYNGDGVVMVGADSLDIFEDQAVLLPVITANYVADHGEPIQWLYEMVRTRYSWRRSPSTKDTGKESTEVR